VSEANESQASYSVGQAEEGCDLSCFLNRNVIVKQYI
jgi:hypothetical protein